MEKSANPNQEDQHSSQQEETTEEKARLEQNKSTAVDEVHKVIPPMQPGPRTDVEQVQKVEDIAVEADLSSSLEYESCDSPLSTSFDDLDVRTAQHKPDKRKTARLQRTLSSTYMFYRDQDGKKIKPVLKAELPANCDVLQLNVDVQERQIQVPFRRKIRAKRCSCTTVLVDRPYNKTYFCCCCWAYTPELQTLNHLHYDIFPETNEGTEPAILSYADGRNLKLPILQEGREVTNLFGVTMEKASARPLKKTLAGILWNQKQFRAYGCDPATNVAVVILDGYEIEKFVAAGKTEHFCNLLNALLTSNVLEQVYADTFAATTDRE